MRGDFSAWNKDRSHNFRGTLHQQGRVLLDRDWNAQTEITGEWQETAACDAFGAGVAAVPAAEPLSFKVIKAEVSGPLVKVSLKKGRVWADGLLAELGKDAEPPPLLAGVDAVRTATYLGPPIQTSPGPDVVPSVGDRDAVILETWLEELSPFQDPDLLIEAALGGVDTTERVQTAFRFRLYRMAAGDTCDSLIPKLKDDFSAKGKLTAELTPTVTIDGDCPVVASGGFTGFEHRLYRIEIADTDRAAPESYFKWSHFNGGLVGTGDFDAAARKVTIHGNKNAIVHSGLNNFYLEALDYESTFGCWQVVYGAKATLAADGTLGLPDPGASPGDIFKGVIPPVPTQGKRFFRLWNGIERVADFTAKKDLPDNLGILIQLEPEGAGKYTPSDFWTFEVRAGGIGNPPVLIPTLPPQGINYHRVPLAILNWIATAAAGEIHDCRKEFPPLVDISAGCCIAVKPGSDIHLALRKVFEAGGGCICLLPGNHYLTKPIDLSQRSGIHIKGFGLVSRLHITAKMKNSPPFILSDSQDLSFESFAVFSQNGAPVWSCKQTQRLTIRNMFVTATFLAQSYPVIAIARKCHEWRLENNAFSGPMGLAGTLLSDSTISGNLWQGLTRGIDLKYLQRSRVEGNRFIGLHGGHVEKFEVEIEAIRTSDSFASRPLLNLVERTLVRPELARIAPLYIGLDISVGFDVAVIDNFFLGSIGISAELIEKCKIHANDFMTTVTAASCGMVHSLRFSENRVGQGSGEFRDQKGIACKTGLLILADAVDCQVVNNAFANVQQGIVYESDIRGRKAVIRDFSANVFRLERVTTNSAKKLLLESEARVKMRLDKQLLLNSSFFRIGKCQHTLIQGNRFNATQSGIEWSGTKNIVDFRIDSNSFTGCQDVAIQIEPDDRMFYLADPVDTKVRLIEKNRFEVYSGAVRATIGAVRVEKNDIRVKPPKRALVPPLNILVAAADTIYRAAPYTKAVKASDVPMMRMMSAELVNAVEKNPDTINTTRFSKAINDTVLDPHKPLTGDVWADKAFVMKSFADISANNYLAADINANIASAKLNLEGYAVNLSGVQNRVAHNRIYGNNTQRPGGIVFHVVSGEVRDNEVAVPAMALLLNGKLGLAVAYKGAEIVGNSLTASGIPGKKSTIYAMAIPSLSAGNLSIANNQFMGSVMIGGDPIAAQGFAKKNQFKVANEVIFYNVIKFDMPMYAISAVAKAFPATIGDFGKFKPPVIVIPAWLLDPHAARPVVQFSNNRLIKGWLGIFQALSGAYWSKALLKKLAARALVANLAGNVLDYGGSVVGTDVIIVGNQSQLALKYRANREEAVANLPAAQSF